MTELKWFLGRPPRIPIPRMEGFSVHLGSSIQDTVAFLGFEDSSAPGEMRCFGTALLVHYKGFGYLVTARHVVEPLGDAPFLIRVNRIQSGIADVIRVENLDWKFHADETVDLSAISFDATHDRGFQCLYFFEDDILNDQMAKDEFIDIGDYCYTVGLFRYMSGYRRNDPVLFSGHIAFWNGEQIPIWNNYKRKKEFVNGHLVQSHALQGASGSPVFVRPAFGFSGVPFKGKSIGTIMVQDRLFLMGIMQGAWFLPPDELLRSELGAGAGDTVPVGLGIVTPSSKVLELLENTQDFQEMRKKNPPIQAVKLSEFAKQTSLTEQTQNAQSIDANPKHREDFNSLLGAADVKKD
jgi:hypothetical protein